LLTSGFLVLPSRAAGIIIRIINIIATLVFITICISLVLELLLPLLRSTVDPYYRFNLSLRVGGSRQQVSG